MQKSGSSSDPDFCLATSDSLLVAANLRHHHLYLSHAIALAFQQKRESGERSSPHSSSVWWRALDADYVLAAGQVVGAVVVGRDEHCVLAGATADLVAAAVVAPGVDHVVALAPREPVLARAAKDPVRPVGTADHVVALVAFAAVSARTQHHGVVSAPSIHEVIAGPGVDKVRTVGPYYGVWAGRTLKELGQGGSAKQHNCYKERPGERYSNLASAPPIEGS